MTNVMPSTRELKMFPIEIPKPRTGTLGRSLMFIASVLPLAACSDTVDWKEEVRMADGRVIIVEQKRKCAGGDFKASTEATCVATEAWLGVKLPETGNQEVTWHERLKPLVLNVSQGNLYVVGFPDHPSEFRLYGATNPPYVGYVWRGTQWQRVPFEQIPPAIYDTNLLIHSIPKTRTKLLSLEVKGGPTANGSPRLPTYLRRIDPNFKKPLL